MFKINDNYLKLPGSYLFSTIAKKVNAYSQANPEKKIIRLGIGDVTQPLAPAIIDALHGAVDEMGKAETFHGYALIWDMNFCGIRLPLTIIRHGGAILRRMKFLFPMGQNAIPAISRKYSAWIIKLRFATRYIRCMWIPMLWRGGPELTMRQRGMERCDLHALPGGK